MENLLETINHPQEVKELPAFYIDKRSGRVYYESLPKDTYYAMGVNGTVKNQAFWFGFDSGTCLIPFCHTCDNSIVIKND